MKKRMAAASIFVLTIATNLGACVSMQAADLDGTWYLVSVDGAQVPSGSNQPNFTIDGDAISGFDGCNRFGGSLSNPQAMIVGQRACADQPIGISLDLSDPQSHLSGATIDGDRLRIPRWKSYPEAIFEKR